MFIFLKYAIYKHFMNYYTVMNVSRSPDCTHLWDTYLICMFFCKMSLSVCSSPRQQP